RRVNLDLVPEDGTARFAALDRFAGRFDRLAFPNELAADLYAGVEVGVDLEIEVEDEIAVGLGRAQKRVGRIRYGAADDDPVLRAFFRVATAGDPAVEVLFVEQRDPAAVVRNRIAGRTEHGDQDGVHAANISGRDRRATPIR